MSNIQDTIEQEREQARATCDTSGSESAECAAAWDAVEELQVEIIPKAFIRHSLRFYFCKTSNKCLLSFYQLPLYL